MLLRELSVLLILPGLVPAHAQNAAVAGAKPDAAQLLMEVAKKYAQPTAVRIEAIKEESYTGSLHYQWTKSYMTLVFAPGNRFRIEGRSAYGSYLQTSNGTMEMITSLGNHRYVLHAVPAKGPTMPHVIYAGSEVISYTWGMTRMLESELVRSTDAVALPDAVVTIGGVSFDCFVVKAKSEHASDEPAAVETFWIDKRSKVIREYDSVGETSFTDNPGLKERYEVKELFPVVDLDAHADAKEFVQPHPPGDRVASLEPEFAGVTGPTHRPLHQVPGKQVLGAADGKLVTLESFQGRPLLIDFWATWCGPCVEAMPALTRLAKEAEKSGVAVLSIDEDEKAESAARYFSAHAYTWRDLHDDGSLLRRFEVPSIPTLVLIDAQGKTVFNGNPDRDHDALYAAIRKAAPQFSDAAAK
ncbi:MAG TPA: TlpA disulfide reductase family protein [Acidobacteriaceae bacterium]|jgi:thiol-disulfide isomerase/thioredoxin